MSADQVAALVAAIVAAVTSIVLVAVVVVLGRRLRELGRLVEELRGETVPLVRDARVVVDQAATEMVRVGDVLDSAEAVSSTVDSASRLAYRAFSNPVVKVLAYSTGVGSALRRFFGRRPPADVGATGVDQRPRRGGRHAPPRHVGGAGPGPAPARPRRDAPMIRRPLWLAAGAALGVGGTVWTRRRLEQLSRRVRPTAVAGDLASMVDRTRRQTVHRVRDAVDTGRKEARAPRGRPVARPRPAPSGALSTT